MQKGNFAQTSKNLAIITNLKIILLDYPNNYTYRTLKLIAKMSKLYAPSLIMLEIFT